MSHAPSDTVRAVQVPSANASARDKSSNPSTCEQHTVVLPEQRVARDALDHDPVGVRLVQHLVCTTGDPQAGLAVHVDLRDLVGRGHGLGDQRLTQSSAQRPDEDLRSVHLEHLAAARAGSPNDDGVELDRSGSTSMLTPSRPSQRATA